MAVHDGGCGRSGGASGSYKGKLVNNFVISCESHLEMTKTTSLIG